MRPSSMRHVGFALALLLLAWPIDQVQHVSAEAREAFVLPGEFEPVDRLLIAWDDELGDFLAAIMGAAATETDITVLLDSDSSSDELERWLARLAIHRSGVEVVRIPVPSIWIRDFGPLVTRSNKGMRRVVDFDYSFDEIGNDIPGRLQPLLWPRWRLQPVPLPLDGGNLQSDGAGRCITAAGYSGADEGGDLERSEIDVASLRRQLKSKLGCSRLFILPPLFGEPTAHVDIFAMITGPGQIVVGSYHRKRDRINARRLDRAAEILRRGGFQVRRIPMPDRADGLFRTYTNALALNRIVLVPVYPEDTRHEKEALAVFRAAYPGRTIVPVDASSVIQLYGAIHCATMTIAAGR